MLRRIASARAASASWNLPGGAGGEGAVAMEAAAAAVAAAGGEGGGGWAGRGIGPCFPGRFLRDFFFRPSVIFSLCPGGFRCVMTADGWIPAPPAVGVLQARYA